MGDDEPIKLQYIHKETEYVITKKIVQQGNKKKKSNETEQGKKERIMESYRRRRVRATIIEIGG